MCLGGGLGVPTRVGEIGRVGEIAAEISAAAHAEKLITGATVPQACLPLPPRYRGDPTSSPLRCYLTAEIGVCVWRKGGALVRTRAYTLAYGCECTSFFFFFFLLGGCVMFRGV